MKRIIYHWTAGTYTPNNIDLSHYHFIIDNMGKTQVGKFTPEDNIVCLKNQYAQHTGGGNSNSIGIALAGMAGFINVNNIGKYPLTKLQCEVGFELGARLIKKYNLDIDEKLTVQTHHGFGKRNPHTTSNGKIDIIYLPAYPDVQQDEMEDFIRNKIIWYLKKR